MIPSRYVVMDKKPNELEWNYNYVFHIWWIVRLTHSPLRKLTVFEFLSLSAFSISLLELRGRRLWIELSSLSIQKKQEQTNLKLNALHESNNRSACAEKQYSTLQFPWSLSNSKIKTKSLVCLHKLTMPKNITILVFLSDK